MQGARRGSDGFARWRPYATTSASRRCPVEHLPASNLSGGDFSNRVRPGGRGSAGADRAQGQSAGDDKGEEENPDEDDWSRPGPGKVGRCQRGGVREGLSGNPDPEG